MLDLVGEQRDVVAHSPLAELPEVRQVAANLRGVDLGKFGESRRGDGLAALGAEMKEHVEVRREPLNDSLRYSVLLLNC